MVLVPGTADMPSATPIGALTDGAGTTAEPAAPSSAITSTAMSISSVVAGIGLLLV
jgi:hypothetical protein